MLEEQKEGQGARERAEGSGVRQGDRTPQILVCKAAEGSMRKSHVAV